MDTPRHPFAFRDFRFYWAARFTSTIAQLSMVIVIGWQVYDIARHQGMSIRDASLQLGWIGAAQFAPLLVLTLITGWTADRLDRRWISRSTCLLELCCAGALALAQWHHATTLPALFAVAALLGVARAFAGPALGALAPNLVPPAVLPTAIAFSAISWQSGAVVGPALGGYLYAVAPWVPYATSTGCSRSASAR